MKFSIFKILFFTSAVILLFPTCAKDDNPDDPSGIEEGTFSAKIDGVEFKPVVPLAGIVLLGTTEIFTIGGANNSITTLSINFWVAGGASVEKTTYQHDELDCVAGVDVCGSLLFSNLTITESLSTEVENGSVEISFTSIDYRKGGHCIGTFSGVLIDENQNTINVTDGKFNLKIAE